MDELVKTLHTHQLSLCITKTTQPTIDRYKWEITDGLICSMYLFIVLDKDENTLSLTYVYFLRKNIRMVEKHILLYLLSTYQHVSHITLHFLSVFSFMEPYDPDWDTEFRMSSDCFLCYCHQIGFVLYEDNMKDYALYDQRSCCACCFIEKHGITHIIGKIAKPYKMIYHTNL